MVHGNEQTQFETDDMHLNLGDKLIITAALYHNPTEL